MRQRLNRLFRPTVRLRLTLFYGCLFFVVAAAMLVLLYALLSRELGPRGEGRRGGPPFVQGPGGGQVVVVVDLEQRIFEVRRDERTAALRQVPRLAVVALIATTLVALLLGWLVSGQMLRPLRQITRHARLASETTLSDRIALEGPADELKELADTMDAMLARLESAFVSQRQFAAQASHELRTPLAIIQAEADVALSALDATSRERELAEAVRSAAIRSERLVDGLLALSRSDSSMRDSVQLDLGDIAGDVAGELVGAADARGITIDLQLETAMVRGDRALLERLVGNLFQNAIRYNRPSGWIRLVVRPESDRGQPVAMIVVENSGLTVPESEVASLFDPFQRGSSALRERTAGYGLGLAIIRSVTMVHGGRVEAVPGSEGGLRVTVRVPLAGPAALPELGS